MSINQIRTYIKVVFIERILLFVYRNLYKMKIGDDTKISLKAMLDKTNPKGINIDNFTMITAGVCILTHDFVNQVHKDTFVGKNCFIGMNSIIMPGVKIEDNVVVGAGSVVTKDLPSNTICAGNPARIIRSNVNIKKYGIIDKISPTLASVGVCQLSL